MLFGAEPLQLPAKFWCGKPRAVLLRDNTDVSATRHVLVLIAPLRFSAVSNGHIGVFFESARN
jgi:hypothetical protein